MRIRLAGVGGLGGHGPFQPTHRCRFQIIYLIQTNQSELRQTQNLVLIHLSESASGLEIGIQLGWQQMFEPAGFVYSLFAYQHQYLLVYHFILQPPRYHAYQPFAQTGIKQQLLVGATLYVYVHRQREDGVGGLVPWWQAVQVLSERIIQRYKIRVDNLPYFLGIHILLFRQHTAQRVHQPVLYLVPPIGRSPFVQRCFARGVFYPYGCALTYFWYAELVLTRNHIMAQVERAHQEFLDILLGGTYFAPILLVLSFPLLRVGVMVFGFFLHNSYVIGKT